MKNGCVIIDFLYLTQYIICWPWAESDNYVFYNFKEIKSTSPNRN